MADDSTIGILVATGLGKSGQPQQCLLMYPQATAGAGRGPAGTKSDTEVRTPPER
ncbi:hypothetical protein [Nocardia sp. NPDC005998]|uniref:hypothetical protein n=1 Tax=Nocardia sp. NPDC005998 TaxID=3156894 RepID=UPI0033AE589D